MRQSLPHGFETTAVFPLLAVLTRPLDIITLSPFITGGSPTSCITCFWYSPVIRLIAQGLPERAVFIKDIFAAYNAAWNGMTIVLAGIPVVSLIAFTPTTISPSRSGAVSSHLFVAVASTFFVCVTFAVF